MKNKIITIILLIIFILLLVGVNMLMEKNGKEILTEKEITKDARRRNR